MTEDSAFRVAQHVFVIGHVGGFGKLLQAGPDFSDIFDAIPVFNGGAFGFG